eukprot:3973488-Amphidinium_carterae.1
MPTVGHHAEAARMDELSRKLHDQHDDHTRSIEALKIKLFEGKLSEGHVAGRTVDELSEQLQNQSRSLEELKLRVSTLQDPSVVSAGP